MPVDVSVVALPSFWQLEMHPSYVCGSTSSTKSCSGDTAAAGHAVRVSTAMCLHNPCCLKPFQLRSQDLRQPESQAGHFS